MQGERFRSAVQRFEGAVVSVLAVILAVVIVLGVGVLVSRLVVVVVPTLKGIQTVADLQEKMYAAFGGTLIVLLGLELLETMMVYHREHRVRVEVILVVALIAVARHIIELDVKHVSPMTLIGTAALMLALAGSYFIVRRGAEDTR